jgi:hypothetical protein
MNYHSTSTRKARSVNRSEFDRYTGELLEASSQHPLVLGLVLMGSTADTSRADEWSDYDFAVIVQPGTAEQLRSDLSWLPRHADLVSHAREVHDGYCGIYANGHVIEFAVTDLPGLASWHANSYSVVLDRGGVTEAMALVAGREKPASVFGRDFGILLAALATGVGRARRGEVLSASGVVRGRCVELLLGLLSQRVSSAVLDDLDTRRRFELVFPLIGTEIELALQRPVIECARLLLELAARELAAVPGYPSLAIEVVRRAFDAQPASSASPAHVARQAG